MLDSWKVLANEEAALAVLRACGLGSASENALFDYCRLLHEYDSHTNLVARSAPEILLKEHVLDSLQLLPFLSGADKQAAGLIDIGSGAGFPGLVLALSLPSLNVTLVESVGKKCRFLENAVSELGLSDRVRVFCQRAETLGHDKKMREHFQFATARAVGALPVVAELCLPFLRIGGLLLAQRSRRQALVEQDGVVIYATRLGAELTRTHHFEPDLLGRELSLQLLAKRRATPALYARSAAQIKHAPL